MLFFSADTQIVEVIIIALGCVRPKPETMKPFEETLCYLKWIYLTCFRTYNNFENYMGLKTSKESLQPSEIRELQDEGNVDFSSEEIKEWY